MTRNLNHALSRIGRHVPVYEKTSTGENSFGQNKLEWNQTRTVLAALSYQNRNTTRNNTSGQLHRDRPVFFFPADSDIRGDARIKYEGAWYELDAPTKHHTHTVAVGAAVVDENFPP